MEDLDVKENIYACYCCNTHTDKQFKGLAGWWVISYCHSCCLRAFSSALTSGIKSHWLSLEIRLICLTCQAHYICFVVLDPWLLIIGDGNAGTIPVCAIWFVSSVPCLSSPCIYLCNWTQLPCYTYVYN